MNTLRDRTQMPWLLFCTAISAQRKTKKCKRNVWRVLQEHGEDGGRGHSRWNKGGAAGRSFYVTLFLQASCTLPRLISDCAFPTQEVDEFFEQEKTFLLDYYSKIKDSTGKAEKMTRAHKSMLELISSKVPI